MFDTFAMKPWNCSKSVFTLIFLTNLGVLFILLDRPDSHPGNFYNWLHGTMDKANGGNYTGMEHALHMSQPSVESQVMQTTDKWIVLLNVNDGFFDLFENWWRHFRRLGLKETVTIVAEDDSSFIKLKGQYNFDNVRIVRSWILNISEAQKYGSREYKQIVSARPHYLLKYLRKGDNVLYSDVDTVLLKNPFSFFTGSYDMWVQSINNKRMICAGFMAIKSNTKTTKLMQLWGNKLDERLQRNQPALNQLIRNEGNSATNLSVAFLSDRLFIGGREYPRMSRKQRAQGVMVHATLCGFYQKRSFLMKWNLWFNSSTSQ